MNFMQAKYRTDMPGTFLYYYLNEINLMYHAMGIL